LSIEDATRSPDQPLYPLSVAVERIRSARHAIDRIDADTMLIGRAECFLVGHANLEETIARLRAYASAGADCVYAPGVRTREQIEAIVTAVAPTPVNVLIGTAVDCSISELAALGVRRVSVGGTLARVAWGAFSRAARALADEGSCAAFVEAMSSQQLNQFFSVDQEQRRCDSSAP
jgi:2-methylisocitrate lyase-like PEP mutase family enzyme